MCCTICGYQALWGGKLKVWPPQAHATAGHPSDWLCISGRVGLGLFKLLFWKIFIWAQKSSLIFFLNQINSLLIFQDKTEINFRKHLDSLGWKMLCLFQRFFANLFPKNTSTRNSVSPPIYREIIWPITYSN